MKPYIIKPHLARKITIMQCDDARVPKALAESVCQVPDLTDFPYPLPSKKSDYTCYAEGNNGILWLGGKSGVTRYDEKAEREIDKIMYFSAKNHLADNNVEKILADGDDLWVLTGDKVTHIEMVMLGTEEKANILHEETKKYVQRRGMVSHRDLKVPRDFESRYPYAACDNDGLFTAGYTMGELFHYATLRRKYGEADPRVIEARQDATLGCEACLLLMYIHGRDEGFISRSYHVTGEPVPDDGFFYKRDGKVARLLETNATKKRNLVGEEVPCEYPVPDRLAKLYRDLGYTEDDITYKADTSSDEISGHFLQMRFAHEILGPDDPELDEIIKHATKRTMKHIIDGGFEFKESSGRSTTWAKWSKEYFSSESIGYVDACLNACELLMFLKVTMYITGEEGIWLETYNKLIADGYADLGTQHINRFYQGAMSEENSLEESLMYGDNMLALLTFWALCDLEKDEKLLAIYRESFKTWKGLLCREYNPGYDFPLALSCPDTELDMEREIDWFNRFGMTRLGASFNKNRHDYPVKIGRNPEYKDGYEYSALPPLDESSITKYDRNPFHYCDGTGSDGLLVESCYVYTFAYWIGRYYGFIDEEDNQ